MGKILTTTTLVAAVIALTTLATITTIAQSASAVVSEGCAKYAPIEQCLGHDAIMTVKRFLDGVRDGVNER